MRVAVDINDLGRPQSGIGRYICGLLQGFASLAGDYEFVLLHKDHLQVMPDLANGRFTFSRTGGRSETWWGQITLPRQARAVNAAALLCPAVRAPVWHRVPVVLTVHDVIFAVHPEHFTLFDRTYMSLLLQAALPRCQRIIAVSAATRDDLAAEFGVPPWRVRVIYHGIETRFHPRDPEAARAELRTAGIALPDRIVLFVGTLEPRKNLLRLVRAMGRLREKGAPHVLVVAGKPGWLAEPTLRALEQGTQKGYVRYLGHVPDHLLPHLYAAAEVVAYPSLYEGFGFPVLEGMACGIPVVASLAPGIREVAGDCCLLVDPLDEDALVVALRRAMEDETLRDRLRQSGLARARGFRWEETARQTLAVLSEAAA